MHTIQDVAQTLRNAQRLVLTTHVNADGDGIGCQVALDRFLRDLGKDVHVLNSDPMPDQYAFLDPEQRVGVFDLARHGELLRSCDAIVVIDNGSLQRFGEMQDDIRRTRAVRVCIDHHSTRDDDVWDIGLYDEDACASGEIVYRLIRAMGGTVDLASARALYVSLITDTGQFRFSKTSSDSHMMAADLLRIGVQPAAINTLIYERRTLGYTRLLGHILSHTELVHGGRLAWIGLDARTLKACDALDEDTSCMVNELLCIQGVSIALLLREQGPERTKVSLRSKRDIDVNRIAREFGGGGHKNASGVVLELPLARAAEVLLERAGAALTPAG